MKNENLNVETILSRHDSIRDKGLEIPAERLQYAKVKLDTGTLVNPTLNLSSLASINKLADKAKILTAISTNNIASMIETSDFFFRTSGIYSRLCKYLAYLYRYDWYVTPYVSNSNTEELNKKNQSKMLVDFDAVLRTLDKFEPKKFFGEASLKVLRYGAYYGYIVRNGDAITIQELPLKYCRSRFSVGGRPVVEFSMKYFNDVSRDVTERLRILEIFPKEFKKGYLKFLDGQLDREGWYLLDTEAAFKFNLNGEDYPSLISVIPAILDLDEAKGLDRKKMIQKLSKILVQKVPLDKNNELLFDSDEIAILHKNAVGMLTDIVGVDVLTSIADIAAIDMTDRAAAAGIDETKKVERALFNETGTAQGLFNSEGNLALEKSIANDEASIYNLIQQYESFMNLLIKPFNKNPKKIEFRVSILSTTIYNYQKLSDIYKAHTQLGYSKILPQIALGQSQSTILATAYFENDILDLVNVFIPPASSATTSGSDLLGRTKTNTPIKTDNNTDGKTGRPALPDDEKSDKTIANKESMS